MNNYKMMTYFKYYKQLSSQNQTKAYNQQGQKNLKIMSKRYRPNHQTKQPQDVEEVNQSPQSATKRKTKEVFKPRDLLKRFRSDIKEIVDHTQNQKKANKQKGTNIPKFIINMFLRNYPVDLETGHLKRLETYKNDEGRSKTRFDLEELFGLCETDRLKNLQNHLNRTALLRILNNNYENILTNQHIVNKKTYLLFCKKLILRLRQPHLIDRLQVS